ncbi:MAG: hypothetical protein NTW10_12135 [Bacteroidetes bacterium]|nr:hypothetical protein [Bacteroidota bacterium]
MGQLRMKIKKVLINFMKRNHQRLAPLSDIDNFESYLYFLLQREKKLNYIQIGANDGKMADPIYDFVTRNHLQINGLVIEPMKDVFQKLVNTFQNYKNITPLNLAIHNKEKEMNLWRINPEIEHLVPPWSNGISSFDKEHLSVVSG